MAVAPHNPGFQTVILPGSPGHALYLSVLCHLCGWIHTRGTRQNDGLETGISGGCGREISVDSMEGGSRAASCCPGMYQNMVLTEVKGQQDVRWTELAAQDAERRRAAKRESSDARAGAHAPHLRMLPTPSPPATLAARGYYHVVFAIAKCVRGHGLSVPACGHPRQTPAQIVSSREGSRRQSSAVERSLVPTGVVLKEYKCNRGTDNINWWHRR